MNTSPNQQDLELVAEAAALTCFDLGERFPNRDAVRKFFTKKTMAHHFGPDHQFTTSQLNAWQQAIVNTRTHMGAPMTNTATISGGGSASTEESTGTVQDIRATITARLNEIRPYVSEVRQLEGALAALDGGMTKASGSKTGRPKGTGGRTKQVLELLSANTDGLTTTAIAEALEMNVNYLYRLLPGLHEDGTITKDSDGAWILPTA